MRHRRLHAARERRVAGIGGERVQPHDPVRAALQPRHLLRQQLGVAAVPAVGQHDDERAAADAAAVHAVELGERLADAGAARPVLDRVGGALQRAVGVAARQLARHARQPRAEHERLDARARRDRGLQVLQQHPRVGRHRARDVADEHEPARALGRLAVAALDELAAVAQRDAQRGAQVVHLAAAARPLGAPAEPRRTAARELGEQPPRGRALGVGQAPEVLVAQELLLAPRGRDGDEVDLHGPRRLVGHADARERHLRALAHRLERVRELDGGCGEDRLEGGREDGEVRPRRAHRRLQREIGVLPRRRVDRRQRAVGGEQLAQPDVGARCPHVRGQACERRGDGVARAALVRHRPGLPTRAPARCPRGPSGRPRGSRRAGRPDRARAGRAPR